MEFERFECPGNPSHSRVRTGWTLQHKASMYGGSLATRWGVDGSCCIRAFLYDRDMLKVHPPTATITLSHLACLTSLSSVPNRGTAFTHAFLTVSRSNAVHASTYRSTDLTMPSHSSGSSRF